MHRLVKAKDSEGVRGLLASHPDPKTLVNKLDEHGFSPLWHAVDGTKPNLEVVEMLLRAGADTAFVYVQKTPGFSATDLASLMPESMKEQFEANREEALASLIPEGMADQFQDLLKMDMPPTEHRRWLLSEAIQKGGLGVSRLFQNYGANLQFHDDHGYTAIDAATRHEPEDLELLRFLIDLGCETSAVSSYGESAIRNTLFSGRFASLSVLVEAGADESTLQWTPLIKAVAIGTVGDVERELSAGGDVNARDTWERTAFHTALMKGDLEKAKLLLSGGADLLLSPKNESTLELGVDSGNVELVEWLIDQGCDLESKGYLGGTALARAATIGNQAMITMLLDRGADPNARSNYESVVEAAKDRETSLLLISRGADPSYTDREAKRVLLGFGEEDESPLYEVTQEQYLAAKKPREGIANPEDLTQPFRVAMIRAGVNAYRARKIFNDDPTFACGLGNGRDPVWCADRFGQSTTLLPDGRIVLIAGEHEDSYDPDFCIYNDVWVLDSSGRIAIYGYPYSHFPPTDFHTATLVGDSIYIIGGLGYMGKRAKQISVFRLDTRDFHIERVETGGLRPSQIYDHTARLEGGRIRLEGGKSIQFKKGLLKGKEEHPANTEVFELDLESFEWSQPA